jgi:hypothetical protein
VDPPHPERQTLLATLHVPRDFKELDGIKV